MVVGHKQANGANKDRPAKGNHYANNWFLIRELSPQEQTNGPCEEANK